MIRMKAKINAMMSSHSMNSRMPSAVTNSAQLATITPLCAKPEKMKIRIRK